MHRTGLSGAQPPRSRRVAIDLPPVKAAAPAQETEEEAAEREAEHEQRMDEYQAEQKRREEERKAEFDRQQKEYEAEQAREKQRKARVATFERIIDQAPATLNVAQMRVFIRLLLHMEPYEFLEATAAHFANGDENTHQSDGEIVLVALDSTADEKLTVPAHPFVQSRGGLPSHTSSAERR